MSESNQRLMITSQLHDLHAKEAKLFFDIFLKKFKLYIKIIRSVCYFCGKFLKMSNLANNSNNINELNSKNIPVKPITMDWNSLISKLLQQLEWHHTGLTLAKKKEMIRNVLVRNKYSDDKLYKRLGNLLTSWQLIAAESNKRKNNSESNKTNKVIEGEGDNEDRSASTVLDVDTGVFLEIRKQVEFLLTHSFLTIFETYPDIVKLSKDTASAIRKADSVKDVKKAWKLLKRFALKVEFFSQDQQELQKLLFRMLELLVDNISELITDNSWIQGQIGIIQKILKTPLTLRTLKEAERVLTEVLFKQSQLKAGLIQSQTATAELLANFVNNLADFSDNTSSYHETMNDYAQKIAKITDPTELNNVLSLVMKQTQEMQTAAKKTSDSLQQAQINVQKANEKIEQLELELSKSSKEVTHDQITGVLNLNGFNAVFSEEIKTAKKSFTPLCVGIFSIDNLRATQQLYGENIAESIFKHLCQVCQQNCLRPQDNIARIDVRNFAVIFPNAEVEEAKEILLNLQRELTKAIYLHNKKDKVIITFSAGITALKFNTSEDDEDDEIDEISNENSNNKNLAEETPSSMLKRALIAMKNAQTNGKNKVEILL